ncbi:hypothetical protein [Lysinibacillus sp. TE18511]
MFYLCESEAAATKRVARSGNQSLLINENDNALELNIFNHILKLLIVFKRMMDKGRAVSTVLLRRLL